MEIIDGKLPKDFAKEFNSKEEFLNTLYSIDLKTK